MQGILQRGATALHLEVLDELGSFPPSRRAAQTAHNAHIYVDLESFFSARTPYLQSAQIRKSIVNFIEPFLAF